MNIYKLKNKINGKIYIGQTTQTIRQRIRGHVNNSRFGSKLPIHCAIRKYGIDGFIIEEIAEAKTIDGLNELEIHYIKILNCLVPYGYNLTSGGKNYKKHQETKDKIRIAAKKRMAADGGKQLREALEKAHQARIGQSTWNKGFKTSAEVCLKLSESHLGQKPWNKGKTTSEDVKEKQRIAKSKISKPVKCLENGNKWDSIEQASKSTGISTTHIKRLIASGKKSGIGLSFKYICV